MAYASLPALLRAVDPQAEPYYWRDVGTLEEAYWKANTDLASVTPGWICMTRTVAYPYAYGIATAGYSWDRSGSHGMTLNSLVSGGCIYLRFRWWCNLLLFHG